MVISICDLTTETDMRWIMSQTCDSPWRIDEGWNRDGPSSFDRIFINLGRELHDRRLGHFHLTILTSDRLLLHGGLAVIVVVIVNDAIVAAVIALSSSSSCYLLRYRSSRNPTSRSNRRSPFFLRSKRAVSQLVHDASLDSLLWDPN